MNFTKLNKLHFMFVRNFERFDNSQMNSLVHFPFRHFGISIWRIRNQYRPLHWSCWGYESVKFSYKTPHCRYHKTTQYRFASMLFSYIGNVRTPNVRPRFRRKGLWKLWIDNQYGTYTWKCDRICMPIGQYHQMKCGGRST